MQSVVETTLSGARTSLTHRFSRNTARFHGRVGQTQHSRQQQTKKENIGMQMRICIFDENSKTYLPLWGIWGGIYAERRRKTKTQDRHDRDRECLLRESDIIDMCLLSLAVLVAIARDRS